MKNTVHKLEGARPRRGTMAAVALLLAAVALSLAVVANAAPPLNVNDNAPGNSPVGSAAHDEAVTGEGYIRISGGGGGISSIDVASETTAVIYLYQVNSAGVITRRWGPFTATHWAGPRALSPGAIFDLVQYTATDQLIVTLRGY